MELVIVSVVAIAGVCVLAMVYTWRCGQLEQRLEDLLELHMKEREALREEAERARQDALSAEASWSAERSSYVERIIDGNVPASNAQARAHEARMGEILGAQRVAEAKIAAHRVPLTDPRDEIRRQAEEAAEEGVRL